MIDQFNEDLSNILMPKNEDDEEENEGSFNELELDSDCNYLDKTNLVDQFEIY